MSREIEEGYFRLISFPKDITYELCEFSRMLPPSQLGNDPLLFQNYKFSGRDNFLYSSLASFSAPANFGISGSEYSFIPTTIACRFPWIIYNFHLRLDSMLLI